MVCIMKKHGTNFRLTAENVSNTARSYNTRGGVSVRISRNYCSLFLENVLYLGGDYTDFGNVTCKIVTLALSECFDYFNNGSVLIVQDLRCLV